MAITSQVDLSKGLIIVDESQMPSSVGKVSDKGMHIPDTGIIDGKNIIPTQSGYTSYFGKDRNIDDTVLGSLNVQEIITYRTKHGDVIQLAFTSDGLYLSSTGGSGTAVRSYANVNLADTTDDLSGGPETIDLSSETGDFTLSVYGTAAVTVAAGTATGTGFAQATEGSDVTFNLSVTGTVTLTLDSGTLDLERGAAMKKVEQASTSTHFIPGSDPSQIRIDLPSGKGDWIKVFWATYGHASVWELWTYALVDNELYIYHKGLKYFYKLYSVEPEQVLFDELTPTYIVSTDKIWQFNITSEDDSAGDDTYKAVEINTDSGIYLGKYSHTTDKAHAVWNIERTVLSPFHLGLPAKLENVVKAKVDIDTTITLGADYTTKTLTKNGAASELIYTWGDYSVAQGLSGRNCASYLTIDDLTTGGVLTLEQGTGPATASVDTTILGTDTKAEILTKVVALVEALNTSYYYHVSFISDFATAKDEISLVFTIASNISGPSSSNNLYIYYTGTATAVTMFNQSGYSTQHAYFNLLKPLYRIDELSGYATFALDEVATVTVDGVDYSVTATASESSSSVLSRLRTEILLNSNFEEWILATPDGSFSFSKVTDTTWDLGGAREAPITVSNNLQLKDTDWFSPDPYVPSWTATAYEATYATLRIQGFKEYGLTQLVITLDGTAYNIPMSSVYDSNDMADLITSLLPGAAQTVTTVASATADYDLLINVPIFDGSTPSATLTQDGTTTWTLASTNSETIDLLQVDGIFYARGRIGYWTNDNTPGWSNSKNPIDFLPSTVTRANQISVKAVQGDIIKCLSYEEGFLIYSTGNIVQGKYVANDANVFRFLAIPGAEGIVDPRHVAMAGSIQFYWNSMGLYSIDPANGQLQEQLEQLGDWINTYSYPVTVQSLAGRFLVLNLLDSAVDGTQRDVRNGNPAIAAYIAPHEGSPVELDVGLHTNNLYPTYKRALLYDTKLGRWGTCDQDYLILSSLTPYNQSAYQADRDYRNTTKFLDNHQRGLLILGTSGKLWLTNDNPDDGYLVVGHYATHRIKRTKVISTYLEFASIPDATMDFEPSLDWKTVDWDRVVSEDVDDLRTYLLPNMSAYWFNFVLRGRFHITRGMIKGQNHGR